MRKRTWVWLLAAVLVVVGIAMKDSFSTDPAGLSSDGNSVTAKTTGYPSPAEFIQRWNSSSVSNLLKIVKVSGKGDFPLDQANEICKVLCFLRLADSHHLVVYASTNTEAEMYADDAEGPDILRELVTATSPQINQSDASHILGDLAHDLGSKNYSKTVYQGAAIIGQKILDARGMRFRVSVEIEEQKK